MPVSSRRLLSTLVVVVLCVAVLLLFYERTMEVQTAPLLHLSEQSNRVPDDDIQSQSKHVPHDVVQSKVRTVLQGVIQSQPVQLSPNALISILSTSAASANTYINKTKSKTKTMVSEIRQNRVKATRRGCKNREQKMVPKSRLDYIIVDDRYEFLFCYIPKVGCSVWKKIFLLLTGKFDSDPSVLDFGTVHKKYANDIRYLNDYPRDEIEYKIRNYKKVIFLRDPLERLLSAYRNKFKGKGSREFRTLAKSILRSYRENATKEDIKKADDVTFEEFIKYVIDEKTEMNDHWQLYTELCHPCYINYNFVGNFETLNDDAETFLRNIGAPKNVTYPQRSELYTTKKSSETFQEFYATIDFDLISQLWDVYKTDYKIFGFSFLESFRPLFVNDKC